MLALPPWPLLSAFLLASLILAITPGPAVFYIVARTVAQGRRSGLASAVGVAAGNLANFFAAAIGLTALFAASSVAFTVVRYAGAAYLVYLGLNLLRSPQPDDLTPAPIAPAARVFRDGFFVALLNPKTTLFFAAFLPQFTDPGRSVIQQTLSLGALFVALALVTDGVYAITAGAVTPWLERSSRRLTVATRLEGTMLIVLGLLAAFGNVLRGR